MRFASLFTRDANGLQAWPDDRTTIQVPARARVESYINSQTGDAGVYVMGPRREDDVRLYIPRGGSVVIEALPVCQTCGDGYGPVMNGICSDCDGRY